MSFDEFLRFMAILLFFILGGLIIYSLSLWMKPKAFSPASVFAFIVLIFSVFGASMGGVNYILETLPHYGEIEIPTSGVVKRGDVAYGIYRDVTGTVEVTFIDWGVLMPRTTGKDNSNFTLYIRNEDVIPIYCTVNWNQTSWDPPNADQFFTLTWNFGETPLYPNRTRKATLNLKVNSAITEITQFSFTIIITASDEPFIG